MKAKQGRGQNKRENKDHEEDEGKREELYIKELLQGKASQS